MIRSDRRDEQSFHILCNKHTAFTQTRIFKSEKSFTCIQSWQMVQAFEKEWFTKLSGVTVFRKINFNITLKTEIYKISNIRNKHKFCLADNNSNRWRVILHLKFNIASIPYSKYTKILVFKQTLSNLIRKVTSTFKHEKKLVYQIFLLILGFFCVCFLFVNLCWAEGMWCKSWHFKVPYWSLDKPFNPFFLTPPIYNKETALIENLGDTFCYMP